MAAVILFWVASPHLIAVERRTAAPERETTSYCLPTCGRDPFEANKEGCEIQMAKPTHEDATLMLQLVQMWPVDQTNWIHSDEFTPDYKEFATKYPPGSDQASNVRGVINWYETIGTLHKHGLLNEDLLFDWLATDSMWDKMKSHAIAVREETGEPRMYENFEAMAKAQRQWAASHDRKAA